MNTNFTTIKSTLIFSFIAFVASISFSQTSCGTVTSYSYTTATEPDGQCTYTFLVNITNSTSTVKGVEYNITINSNSFASVCIQTNGGTSNTVTQVIQNQPCNAYVYLSWVGYTASNGSCSGATCGEIASAILPIKIISFTSDAATDYIDVQWEVNEYNVKDYELMHSLDGKNWKSIAKVNAKGEGYAQYRCTHLNPTSGNNYYQFVSNDTNGQSNLSQIIASSWNGKEKNKLTLVPNLIQHSAELWIENEELISSKANEHYVTIDIYNNVGKMVSSIQKTLQPAISLDLENLDPGTYFIKVRNVGFDNKYCRFIKL